MHINRTTEQHARHTRSNAAEIRDGAVAYLCATAIGGLVWMEFGPGWGIIAGVLVLGVFAAVLR